MVGTGQVGRCNDILCYHRGSGLCARSRRYAVGSTRDFAHFTRRCVVEAGDRDLIDNASLCTCPSLFAFRARLSLQWMVTFSSRLCEVMELKSGKPIAFYASSLGAGLAALVGSSVLSLLLML